MSNIALSIKQMKHLEELGLDTSNASMLWITSPNPNPNFVQYEPKLTKLEVSGNYTGDIMGKDEVIPAYTLQDILSKFPNYKLMHDSPNSDDAFADWEEYSIDRIFSDKQLYHACTGATELEASYKMLCWCLEHKLI